MASVASRVLAAVEGILSGLPEFIGGTVARRQVPFLDRERGETLPLGCVSVEAETDEGQMFGGVGMYGYPVTVVTALASSVLGDDPEGTADLREVVRKALYVMALPGVDEVYDCEYLSGVPYDKASLGTGLSASAQVFIYKTVEDRN